MSDIHSDSSPRLDDLAQDDQDQDPNKNNVPEQAAEQESSPSSPIMTWEDARNWAAGAFDDDGADEEFDTVAFNAALRQHRQSLEIDEGLEGESVGDSEGESAEYQSHEPESAEDQRPRSLDPDQLLAAEAARGYHLEDRPNALFQNWGGDLIRASVRLFRGMRHNNFDTRSEAATPLHGERFASPLRKSRSIDDLSPESPPPELQSRFSWGDSDTEGSDGGEQEDDDEVGDGPEVEKEYDSTDEQNRADVQPETEEESQDEQSHDVAIIEEQPLDEQSHEDAAAEPTTAGGRLSVFTEIFEELKGDPEDDDDVPRDGDDEDVTTPTSAEELALVSGYSLEEGLLALRNMYKSFLSKTLEDPSQTLRLKRQLLEFFTRGQKYKSVDDDVLDEVGEMHASVTAHLYREQREEYHRERDQIKEQLRDQMVEAHALLLQRDEEIGKLRGKLDERAQKNDDLKCALQDSREETQGWKTAWESIRPDAMIEIERRERHEAEDGGLRSIATQTEDVEEPPSDPAPMQVQTASTATQTESTEESIDLSDGVADFSGVSVALSGLSVAAQTNERWRAREEQMRNTVAWRQNHNAILAQLKAVWG